MTRRAVLGFGSLTVGGLVISSLPGCSGAFGDVGSSEGAATGDSFLAQYNAIDPKDIATRGRLVGAWLGDPTNETAPLGEGKRERMFAELRESANQTVLYTGPGVPTLVSRYDDVRTVMSNDSTELFTVAPYLGKMFAALTQFGVPKDQAHFTLCDSDPVRHNFEKGAFLGSDPDQWTLLFSIGGLDPNRYRDMVRSEAKKLVEIVKKRGDHKIDVVRDMARRLPVRVMSRYFGLPIDGSVDKTVDEARMYQWIANAFRSFFLNFRDTSDKTLQALQGQLAAVTDAAAKAKIQAGIDGLMAAREVDKAGTQASIEVLEYIEKVAAQGQAPADTVLGAFQRNASKFPQVFRGKALAANIFGIITGAVVTLEKSISNITDVLLDAKWGDEVLSGAIKEAGAVNMEGMWQYALEALRFRPQGVAVARLTSKDTELGGTKIPAGSFVLAAHPSAMMDKRKIENPTQFVVGRPADNYLHFGAERYTCLGKDLAKIEITEALRAMLSLGLVPGSGQLAYKQPYPDTFVVDIKS